jgi:hypothetical protein
VKEAVHVTVIQQKKKKFLAAYRSLCTDGQSVLNKTGTIQKNGATVRTHCNPII